MEQNRTEQLHLIEAKQNRTPAVTVLSHHYSSPAVRTTTVLLLYAAATTVQLWCDCSSTAARDFRATLIRGAKVLKFGLPHYLLG